jgi:hypothetical protein
MTCVIRLNSSTSVEVTKVGIPLYTTAVNAQFLGRMYASYTWAKKKQTKDIIKSSFSGK